MKLNLHHFSKILSQKESLNSRNQGFSYHFCIMIEGSGSGSGAGSRSGSIPLTSGSGSGSGRPKNTWIRWIRIRNTGYIQNFCAFASFLNFKIKSVLRIRKKAKKKLLCLCAEGFFRRNPPPPHSIYLGWSALSNR